MEPTQRRAVLFAMIGLVCAFLSAALIIISTPLPEVIVVEETILTRANGPPVAEKQLLRSRFNSDEKIEFGRKLHETLSPSAAPSGYPTLAPTSTPETVTTTSSNSTSSVESVAAVMVGLASSIILCSLVLYASDVRERWRSKDSQQDPDVVMDDGSSRKSSCRDRLENESLTSAGSTVAESGAASGYWVQVTSQELVEYEGPSNILPPLLADEAGAAADLALVTHQHEDASISRVSTLTTSQCGFSSYPDIEEKLSRYAIESSSEVTELSDAHRVASNMALTSLVKGDYCDGSVCSSITSQGTDRLRGEECLEGNENQTTPDSTPAASLVVSPDTPSVAVYEDDEDDDANETESHKTDSTPNSKAVSTYGTPSSKEGNELAQLEQLVSGINELEGNSPARQQKGSGVYVRDVVCIIPLSMVSASSLGLELNGAESSSRFATVSKVELSGPLVGRIFIGDAILAVNDQATSGMSAEQVFELFDETDVDDFTIDDDVSMTRTIKLTVMSSESDGSSLSDDGQQSDEDFGCADSAVEV